MLISSETFEKKINYYHIKFAQTLGHLTTLRDHDATDHNIRVAYLSSILGQKIGFDKKDVGS